MGSKSILILGLLFLILTACDDQSKETCIINPEGKISLGTEIAYTGDTLTIENIKWCEDNQVTVLVNENAVPVFRLFSEITSFAVPVLSTSKIKVEILINEKTVYTTNDIPLYPGGGVWKPAAPFPAEGRSDQATISTSNSGYFIGGTRYVGQSTYQNYNDLYDYDILNNSWSLISSDDQFLNMTHGIILDDQLTLFKGGDKVQNTITYDLLSNQINTIVSPNANERVFDNKSFATSDAVYACTYIRTLTTDLHSLNITKYNSSTAQWEGQATKFIEEDGLVDTDINFCFTYKDKAYIGYNELNSATLNLTTYNTTSKEFTDLEGIEIELDGHRDILLRHLFVIDDLAYFVEGATAFIGTDGEVTLTKPNSKLHIYNLVSEEWKMLFHEYPEGFYKVTSINPANRGFAGLSVTDEGALFGYKAEFYEFIPE